MMMMMMMMMMLLLLLVVVVVVVVQGWWWFGDALEALARGLGRWPKQLQVAKACQDHLSTSQKQSPRPTIAHALPCPLCFGLRHRHSHGHSHDLSLFEVPGLSVLIPHYGESILAPPSAIYVASGEVIDEDRSRMADSGNMFGYFPCMCNPAGILCLDSS